MKKNAPSGVNLLLRAERLRRGWSQQELADRVNVTVITINRWERGVTAPSPFFRLQLCALYGKSVTELGLLPEETTPLVAKREPSITQDLTDHPQPPRQLRHLPYRRNPFFTGREKFLTSIHTRIHALPTQVYALCGLGGIGKSQTALEYAYRFHSDYQTILWLQAETSLVLARSCLSFAHRLGISLPDNTVEDTARDRIHDWLEEHEHWLLILDNVEETSIVEPLLPAVLTGSVLLTTRAQASGALAQHMNLTPMTEEESMLLLLRRAKYLQPPANLSNHPPQSVSETRSISQLLGGLPLALDQAGAYIEETGCSLTDYLERYQRHRKALLNRRGSNHMEHPDSIAGTISLCTERLVQQSPAAVELLRCCAFLDHEHITEDLLTVLAPELDETLAHLLDNPLAFDDAIAHSRALSLLQRRAATHSLVMHTLVQEMLRDALDDEECRLWSQRIVRGLNRAFVEEPGIDSLRQNEQLLPQVLFSLRYLERQRLVFPEAGRLFSKAAHYLTLRGHYADAERFVQQAFALSKQLPTTRYRQEGEASLYNCLGLLYEARGSYQQAEQAYHNSLELLERLPHSMHPTLSDILTNMGRLALQRGDFTQAGSFLDRALVRQQHHFGSNHPQLVPLLNLFADLYYQKGLFQRAETMLLRSVAICREHLGDTHPHTIESLSSLATMYKVEGKLQQAERLYQETIASISVNSESLEYYTVPALRGLGLVYGLQGHYTQAEVLLKQAKAICQQISGSIHPETAESLRTLGTIYRLKGNYSEAVEILCQASTVFRKALGAGHPEVATTLSMLGTIYGLQGEYARALEAFKQASEIYRHALGESHPQYAENLTALGTIYGLQEQYQQAEELLQQALRIQESILGGAHPALANTLHSLAAFYGEQGQCEQAQQLAQRALSIRERVWSSDHIEVLTSRELFNKLQRL